MKFVDPGNTMNLDFLALVVDNKIGESKGCILDPFFIPWYHRAEHSRTFRSRCCRCAPLAHLSPPQQAAIVPSRWTR
jgi:hypothetical protein